MTYLCTTVHTSYLQPLITLSSNRRKNRLRASPCWQATQKTYWLWWRVDFTHHSIAVWAGKYCRTPFDTNQKGPFYAGWKEHRQRLPAKLEFPTEHNWTREIIHFHRAAGWKEKMLAFERENTRVGSGEIAFDEAMDLSQDRLRNDWDAFILQGWGKPWKQSGQDVASSVSSGLLNGVATALGSIAQRTSCRLYRGCEWRE